jgi:protein phosphatase methylesterase 1
MSDLQQSFIKAKLARLPPDVPMIFDERDEDAAESEQEQEHDTETTLRPASATSTDSSSSASSTGTIIPSPSRKLFERPVATSSQSRTGPLLWQDFFAQDFYLEQVTESESIRHHVYITPQSGSGPLIVTHHGAGSSGLSFAAFNREIQKLLPDAGILAFDARGHGETTIATKGTQKEDLDLTLPTLAQDLAFIVKSTQSKLNWPQLPNIILLGHSLGGAVVTEVAHLRLLGPSLLGSAIDALKSMDQYLMTRPNSFPSITSGIEWHLTSRTIRNTTSARVSVPSLLIEQPETQPTKYTWRTDLSATRPFWPTWFQGLSAKFLSSQGGKLLILAGTDRLDKELMIGQMQGKYQLQVFPDAGHFVHEDQPERTAQIVVDFYRRNDRSALVLPPKVDDLIKQGKLKGGGGK